MRGIIMFRIVSTKKIGDKKKLLGDVLEQVYIAGATENSIVWHDLRKNPKDLPTEITDVLCYVIHNEHRYYLQGYYNGGCWRCTPLGTYLNDEDVKAWTEIPQFKGE